jgi:hypothetical protein
MPYGRAASAVFTLVVFGLSSNICPAQDAATGAVLGTVTDPLCFLT